MVAHPGEDLGYDLFALEGAVLGAARYGEGADGHCRRGAGSGDRGCRWGCWCGTARRWRRGGLRRRAG